MATQRLTTTTNVGLLAVTQVASLAPADVASINASIMDDTLIVTQNLPALAVASIGNATWTTSVGGLTTVTISSGPALTAVQVGWFVQGEGLAPNTQITAVNASAGTITLSQVPLVGTGAAGRAITITSRDSPTFFIQNGRLTIPNRGTLQVLPGDVVAVDQLTGWPILVSKNAMNTTGSIFKLV